MDEEDYYPLLDAIEGGDVAAVESFLQTPDIDVDFQFDGFRYTPLVRAIRRNHQSIVEVLLAHGAAVNGPVGTDITPLQQACVEALVNEDIVKLLLEHGADVDATTAHDRMTPLTGACLFYSSDAILGTMQLLLNAGADVNGGGGWSALLHWAAFEGNQGATQPLIEAGADVNRVSTGDDNNNNNNDDYDYEYYDIAAGSTPLHFAAFYRSHLGCVTHLLAAGADPNIVNKACQTPLHHAACKSSVDGITALLAAGCDPLHRDNQGRTRFNMHFTK